MAAVGDEALVLGVGDGLLRDPEGRQLAPLAVLPEERTAGDLDPGDVGDADAAGARQGGFLVRGLLIRRLRRWSRDALDGREQAGQRGVLGLPIPIRQVHRLGVGELHGQPRRVQPHRQELARDAGARGIDQRAGIV